MNSGGRGRHLRILTLPILMLGAAAVVVSWPGDEPAGTSPSPSSALRVQIEPETAVEPDPAQELAAQVQAMRASDEPPVFHYNADGSVSADLGRRFLKMSVATVDADGQVRTSCLDANATTHEGCLHTTSSEGER